MASQLKRIVENILISVPDTNSIALLSNDGLPIVTATVDNYDDDKIMAITSAFQHLSASVKEELKFKKVSEIIIRGDQGVLLITYVQKYEALLYISAFSNVKLGILIMEAQRAVDYITKEMKI
jgi:predicted regulator of Ras-like GTPase activity (Roadblock/LC7/MglB family)